MIDNIGGTLDWVSETPNNLGSADGQSGGGGGRPLWQLSTSCLILAIEKGVFSGSWVAAGKLLLTLEVEVVVVVLIVEEVRQQQLQKNTGVHLQSS